MSIPEGFKLVPIVPTEQMIAATVADKQGAWRLRVDMASESYAAMLAAAPTPPQPIYDEAKERVLFEAWSAEHYYLGGCSVVMEDGEYKDTDMQYSWESWLACAQSRAKAGEDE